MRSMIVATLAAFSIVVGPISAKAFDFGPKRVSFILHGDLVMHFPDGGPDYYLCKFKMYGETYKSKALITKIGFPAQDHCSGMKIPNLPWRVSITGSDSVQITHIFLDDEPYRQCWNYVEAITIDRQGIWTFNSSEKCELHGSLQSSPAIRIRP